MQKVNVYVHIWNELRSNDRFGLKGSLVDSLCFLRYYPHYYFVTILYFPRRVQGVFYSAQWRRLPRNVVAVRRQFIPHRSLDLASIASRSTHSPRLSPLKLLKLLKLFPLKICISANFVVPLHSIPTLEGVCPAKSVSQRFFLGRLT